jgi:signal transduction histidine kinase
MGIMTEINDEVDDSLEDYSELIIIRSLAGEELPSNDNGSNNQYFLQKITKDYALSRPDIIYQDSMIYIKEKKETEPARILTTIFRDANDEYYELSVYTPTIEKADLKESIFYLLVILFVSLSVVIIVINVWIFRICMKPFYRLLEWLEKYRVGTKNTLLENPTNTTEFQKLNEAVAQFASHNEEVFEQQKLFIGNASHEMQTPLAVCMNRLEMLMEDDSLTENQMKELIETYQTLEYASKLNKSLLMLSKIDNSQFVEEKDIDMNRLIKMYIEDYQEVYSYKDIEVHLEEEGNFVVRMNEVLAVVLVTNLLKNAFVHNVDNGYLYIYMTREGIKFKNSAENGPLDEKYIFERFYQAHRKEGSTGLGLALVDAVCRHSCLGIKYLYEEGWHIFELNC